MEVIARARRPTPKFFRKVRNIGLILTAVGVAIIGSPFAIPAGIVTLAGYLATAGSVASAVAQVTTQNDDQNPPANGTM